MEYTTIALEATEFDMVQHQILVTGANGQLGHCIHDCVKRETKNQDRYYFTDIDDLDICNSLQVNHYVEEHKIDILINVAAYTAVDKAEDEQVLAHKLNCEAVENLAKIAKEHHIYMVHISTDYVFSGKHYEPYTEEEPFEPLSIYGKTKAAGEIAMQASGCNGTIIRTSWLYSEYGHNFVKTMLKAGKEKKNVSVVCDQIGGPTYAGDLAQAILKVIKVNTEKEGITIYHYANEGSISWYDFTKAIMDIAKSDCNVLPIFTGEYPSKAPRPAYSIFNLRKIKREIDIEIPYWRDSLALVINELNC